MTFTNGDIQSMARGVFSYEQINASAVVFDKEIAKLQAQKRKYIRAAEEHVEQVAGWVKNKQYSILGHMYKEGNVKTLLYILRYPDGSDETFRFSSTSIADIRQQYNRLRSTLRGDWSNFDDSGIEKKGK